MKKSISQKEYFLLSNRESYHKVTAFSRFIFLLCFTLHMWSRECAYQTEAVTI